MIFNHKDIHIGSLISLRIKENNTDILRICNFMNCTEEELNSILLQKSLDSNIVLRFSKLLEYDFFRIYSQHLIFYAPQTSSNPKNPRNKSYALPYYRKNIYTKEVVDFVLEQIENGSKTKTQIINDYGIPKSTVYKWINKYR